MGLGVGNMAEAAAAAAAAVAADRAFYPRCTESDKHARHRMLFR